MDKWGDVICPKCDQKKIHAWYFGVDCRYNPSSDGVEACKNCGYMPNEEEKKKCLSELWK